MVLEDRCRIEGIRAVVATDFDGTLLQSDHTISEKSRKTLEMLGAMGVLRVIATGRSFYSLQKVLKDDLPVDYLIVASGAGIYCRESRKLIYKTDLAKSDTELIGNYLRELGCDFMVHLPLPDNHKFLFHKKNGDNPDYDSRYNIYADHAVPLNDFSDLENGSSQFLIVDPPGGNIYNQLADALTGYTIIRTTSPLDHGSTWIEIFPLKTDKGQTLKILAENYSLGAGDVLTIGNDFNDLHMLRWAEESRVVDNAHPDLKAEFETVSSNDNDGFSEAVEEWLEKREK